MRYPPSMAGKVGEKGRKEDGEDGIVAHTPHHYYLQSEHGTRQRRAEDGGEAGTNTYLHHDFSVVGMHPEQARHPVGNGSTHLYTRPLAPRRASEQVGQDSAHIHQRCHFERDNVARRTDLLYQKIVPLRRRTCPIMVHQPNEQAAQGQAGNDP